MVEIELKVEEKLMMNWSMKKDRELMKMARENRNVESLAKKLETVPSQIIKASRRLGISLGPQSVRSSRTKVK